ncbi:MAG TPA: S-methyl-5'-thioadenosine phosphorylase [Peptococcaceae bacterium]|nr:S-methyl-5'-thioadenosine phosphorylase [Peptococcaceae bacterium]
MEWALIGGTGVEKLPLKHSSSLRVDTPYGLISLETGMLGEKSLVFLKRHGEGHSVPPHLINYRGNIWALKKMGVKKILATGAVGSISADFHIGDIVLVDQFLDFTKSRPQTFFEGGEQGVLHVDVSEPYCPILRQRIVQCAENLGLTVKNGGVYVCTEGPRFETPAEIRMYKTLGGQVVGMTGVPEVVLARELGMCYATLALVTNEAAGITQKPLTHSEVIATMNMLGETVAQLIEAIIDNDIEDQGCYCSTGNKEAGMF